MPTTCAAKCTPAKVCDDAQHGDGKNPKTSASALYALIAANADKATKPVGEWNTGRIVLRGSRLEHWLNGKQVVAADLASPEFTRLVTANFCEYSVGSAIALKYRHTCIHRVRKSDLLVAGQPICVVT